MIVMLRLRLMMMILINDDGHGDDFADCYEDYNECKDIDVY